MNAHDEENFVAHLGTLAASVIPSRFNVPDPPMMSVSTAETSAYRNYIARSKDERQIITTPAGNQWTVDIFRSQVVEWSRSRLVDGKLRQGRLYFSPTFVENDKVTNKEPEFVEWADALIEHVRRRYRFDRDLSAYVGPDTQVWLLGGGVLAR
jgi:hypothetical protein